MNIIPIAHLLIGSIDIEEINTSTILQPHREGEAGNLNDAQIEEKLADGKYRLSLNDAGDRIWTAITGVANVIEEVNVTDRNRNQRITQRMITLRREIEEETGIDLRSAGYRL
jgi:hypothetical protein